MAELLTLYTVTLVIFLGTDYFGLSYLIRPIFAKSLGDWLLEDFRVLPALVFYCAYIAGLLVFVSVPATATGVPLNAALYGALLGALAYGTYEFSNFATLEKWTWKMVWADLIWGAVLTGFSAWAGVMITGLIFT